MRIDEQPTNGGIAIAVRGRGAWWNAIGEQTCRRLEVSACRDASTARVVPSFERGHGDPERCARVRSLLVEEAGGRVTDLAGGPLDCSTGHRLLRNEELLASNGLLHAAALEHPLFSLSCAEGWSVKADIVKQVLREHYRPHGLGYDRPCLDVASLPSCHVLDTPAGDVERLVQRHKGVLVATVPFLALARPRSSCRV